MKNKFLLLGVTALISTATVAVNALEYNSVTLGANAWFESPTIVSTHDDMYFGTLDPTSSGRSITIEPNGNYFGDAKIIEISSSRPLRPAHIAFKNANIFDTAQSRFDHPDDYTDDERNHIVTLHLDGGEIELVNASNEAQKCGKIDNLTQGSAFVDEDNVSYDLFVGGTLTLENDFTPTTSTLCRGNTTLTYVLDLDH